MRRRVLALVAGAAFVLGGFGAVERARRSRHEVPVEAKHTETISRALPASTSTNGARPHRAVVDDFTAPRPSDPLTPRTADPLAAVRAALADPSADATALLLRSIDDEADVVRLEAIDGLVDRGHVPALARLLKLDPADDPFVAPSIIAGLGALGHLATEESRRAVLDRLVALLAAEKERRAAESAGNAIMIVEALGVLAHPDGAPALERELGDPFHDVAGYTAIVIAIGKIGQRSSVAALSSFRATRSVAPSDDPFERALERELVEQIDAVTHALRTGEAP